jgi:hypothetical protein
MVIELLSGNLPWSEETDHLSAVLKAAHGEHPNIPAGVSMSAFSFITSCFMPSSSTRPSASELLTHPFLSCMDFSGDAVDAFDDVYLLEEEVRASCNPQRPSSVPCLKDKGLVKFMRPPLSVVAMQRHRGAEDAVPESTSERKPESESVSANGSNHVHERAHSPRMTMSGQDAAACFSPRSVDKNHDDDDDSSHSSCKTHAGSVVHHHADKNEVRVNKPAQVFSLAAGLYASCDVSESMVKNTEEDIEVQFIETDASDDDDFDDYGMYISTSTTHMDGASLHSSADMVQNVALATAQEPYGIILGDAICIVQGVNSKVRRERSPRKSDASPRTPRPKRACMQNAC